MLVLISWCHEFYFDLLTYFKFIFTLICILFFFNFEIEVMALTAAQLLDELMGRDRNLVPGEKSTQVHWSHNDVSTHTCSICLKLIDGNQFNDCSQYVEQLVDMQLILNMSFT